MAGGGGKNASINYEAILLKEFNARYDNQKIRAAFDDALTFGVAVASENTPVRSGRLKGGNGFRILSDTKAEMYNDVEYASVVNDGSSGRPPQPFFDRGAATAGQKLHEACTQF